MSQEYRRGIMRDVIIGGMFAITLLAGELNAANYYVSVSGSNTNAGTSLAKPFLTIQQAASLAQAGDNIYVRGGTYRETVAVANSGTASAPITFQPYGNEQVTITGLDVVSGGWSTYSGSTYQNTVTGGASQLFVNGKMMSEARSSNSGYVNPLRRTYNTADSVSVEAVPTASTITSASLGTPADGTWNGAKMAIISGSEWVTIKTPITGQTGNALNVQWPAERNYYGWAPVAGNRFYLYGSLAAVDTAKEYYYDASNSKLYFNSSVNPNTQTVEVRKRDLGFDLGNKSYINVSGFSLNAANVNVAGTNNRINNCRILYPKAFTDASCYDSEVAAGVQVSGQNNTITNSEIGYSWGSGVTVSGSSNTVSNNVIHDVNWNAHDISAVDIVGTTNNTVTGNTIYNTGRSGILHRDAKDATITHNEIARFGVLTKDLGGTYCYNTDAGGTVIAYNNIHDSKADSVGVYLDDGSSNFTVHHNLITNTPVGIMHKGSGSNNGVFNNTMWGISVMTMANWVGTGANTSTYNNLSNQGTFIGTYVAANMNTTTNQFVNSAAGDYTLKSTSSAINAGWVIAGITDGYIGTPDVGAFEYGATPWTAGAHFKTWLAGNQVAAPLTDAVSVTPSTRTTTGSLIAGRTGSTNASNCRSFMKFDLSGIEGKIESAVLRLYENTAPTSTAGGVRLYTANSSWDSSTINYNQAVTATDTSFYDPYNLDLYTDIDVTSIVQSWLDGTSTNYGFSLRNTSESTKALAKYFEGMYGVTGPQLIITVPEPTSLCLLVSSALLGLAWTWRKRQRPDA